MLAKESEGLKFWKGTGGKLVGVAAVVGVYYWLSEDKEDNKRSNNFSFYAKKPNVETYLNLSSNQYNEVHNEIRLKYLVSNNKLLTTYVFMGFERLALSHSSHDYDLVKTRSYGLATNIEINNYSSIQFEYTKNVDLNVIEASNLEINYQYDF